MSGIRVVQTPGAGGHFSREHDRLGEGLRAGADRLRAGADRLLSAPAWALDAGLTLLVAGIVIVESALPSALHHTDPTTSLVVALAGVLPVAFRRRAPVIALGATSALIGVPSLFLAHDLSFWGTLLPLGLIHYQVARRRSRSTTMLSLLLPALGLGCYAWLTPWMHGDPGLLAFFVIIFGTSTLAGRLVRRDGERREELARALLRLADTEEDRHRLAVLDERTALARDLHDVVAQALSVMIVAARSARTALPVDPSRAETAVKALEAAGRDATADLRRMLELLRASEGPDSSAPTPGLAQLPAVVERMRSAGLWIEVDESVTGLASELPAGIQVAALRIVQEALTNVLRHAGPTEVSLRISVSRVGSDADPDQPVLEVDIIDAGRRSPAGEPAVAGPGRHGLVGMAERVAIYGGTLRTGAEGTGFAVRAQLPLPVPAAVTA